MRMHRWFAAGLLATWATLAAAEFHLWRIEQMYSNADGTVQFIVLRESSGSDGEHRWVNKVISAQTTAKLNFYKFPANLPSSETANKRALVATQGFAALGLITPDYVVPNGFLPTTDTYVGFADVDTVHYASLPTDGVLALMRDGSIVPNVATNFAGQQVSVTATTPPPPPSATNYQGLWWNAPAGSESGWGINFTHQADTIFASWFTFDLDGTPLWMVVAAPKTATAVYSGNLARATGPAFNAVPFDPAQVVGATVGTATFTFADDSNATFEYTIGGATQTKSITREIFGNPVPTCTWSAQSDPAAATNFQDLWWAVPPGSESGWGINFTHQGDTIFATWFTYGIDGKPLWIVVSATRGAPNVYSGKAYKALGPAYNAVPFDSTKIVPLEVGTATFTFTDGNNATFAYTIDGNSQTKTITREIFATASSLCH